MRADEIFFDIFITLRKHFVYGYSGRSRPSDKGGRGRSSRLWGKGRGGLKRNFRPFGPRFGIKIRGNRPRGPLPWIRPWGKGTRWWLQHRMDPKQQHPRDVVTLGSTAIVTEWFPVSCSAISEYCLTERVRQGMIITWRVVSQFPLIALHNSLVRG